MRSHIRFTCLLPAALCWLAPVRASADTEREIELAAIPAAVMEAVESARPGFIVKSAEVVDRDGNTFYEVEGRHAGTDVELLLHADGRIADVEADD